MEIKRKTQITIATRKRFVVLAANEPVEQESCAECGETTLTAESCADVFGVSRREIYRLVEAGNAHFAETDAGVLLVCPASLAEVLKEENL